MAKRLPPGCGLDIPNRILYNVYQAEFQKARKLRKCAVCKSIVSPEPGGLKCPTCWKTHENNTTFPRLYKSLHLRAGRRSGKSLAGALAVREELSIPKVKWWVCGPTFKMLHDATMPSLLRLIPPDWVKNWNEEHEELELTNGSVAQFRSLDDPERARGPGINGAWLDEAAFISQRAWNVLSPTLAENAGVVISTTSPGGFDWTYYEFFKRALIDKRPGYWAAKYKTLDNPKFAESAVLRQEVEEARQTMTPEFFAAEYEGDDVNFTGAIYGSLIDSQVLADDEAVRVLIPEWPHLDPSRQILVGMDSGADHPFGAVMLVVTSGGLVQVNEYLERQQAAVTHMGAISHRFGLQRFVNVKWAANKNEAQLRLEFALRGVMVIPAENSHQIGIQRVQSWLHTKQLWIVASRCPKSVDQYRSYRWADNYLTDGQKKDKEQVFKKADELPDGLRYGIMAWPELPKVVLNPLNEREQKRWDALDDRSRLDIERVRAFNKALLSKDMEMSEDGYPIGGMYGSSTAWGMFD